MDMVQIHVNSFWQAEEKKKSGPGYQVHHCSTEVDLEILPLPRGTPDHQDQHLQAWQGPAADGGEGGGGRR